MRILLAEDEKSVANFVLRGLKAERFAVDWTVRSSQALLWAKVNEYDLAIFDIKLEGEKNGIEICRAVREKERVFPIIILSATHDTAVKIEALNAGADDYLTKPFAFAELLARVKALMRREKKVSGPIIRYADVVIDLNAHSVIRGGRTIQLNRKEFSLLEYLMRNPETILTRSMILEHVWETLTDPFTNTVDVHIRFLRNKLDRDYKQKLIKTVHGYGYKLELHA
jgi:DNA-binding response OmpR family regulator